MFENICERIIFIYTNCIMYIYTYTHARARAHTHTHTYIYTSYNYIQYIIYHITYDTNLLYLYKNFYKNITINLLKLLKV